MGERERNEHGRYSDRIPPETVLVVFGERDDRARPLTAGEVADALDIARRTAHNKLNALVERGELDTRKVGARGRVWWIPIPRDDVDESAASTVDTPPREPAEEETNVSPAEDESTATSSMDVQAAVDTGMFDVPERVAAAIQERDLPPPQNATLEDRHAALAAAWRAVRTGEAQERGDFKPVYEAHPAGFGGLASWYDKFVSPYLRELPGVKHTGSTRNPWVPTSGG